MKLSDIMSHMGLAFYPTVALVLFLSVFVIIAWRTLRTRREQVDRWSNLPLGEDDTAPARIRERRE